MNAELAEAEELDHILSLLKDTKKTEQRQGYGGASK
jgi:hypothetical protein